MLGLAMPQMRLDEVQIVLRSHLFFKMTQQKWLRHMKEAHCDHETPQETISNLATGGECSIFFIINELQKAFASKDICENLILSLKPDLLMTKSEDRAEQLLKFATLKVTNKIAFYGRDLRTLFVQMDTEKRGYCK